MHAYCLSEATTYQCNACGLCGYPEPKRAELTTEAHDEGVPIDEMEVTWGWKCWDCSQYHFGDDPFEDDEPFSSNAVWVCGECEAEYSSKYQAIDCCK